MGCCVSTNKASTSSSSSSSSSSVLPLQPPKPSQTNGTSFQVKEVLSETPNNTTKSEPPNPHPNITPFHYFKEEYKTLFINKTIDTSEIGNLRKTMPSTTTEKTAKRVNGSPVKLFKNCSFPGDIQSVRLLQRRDQVNQKMVNEGMRRRRVPGKNSFRQSPATRADTGMVRSIVGRSPSARKSNRSPVTKARTTPPGNGRRKTEIPEMEGKRSCANESLENPLVSLECFIFI